MPTIKYFTPSKTTDEQERKIRYSLSPIAEVTIPFPKEEFAFLEENIKSRLARNLVLDTFFLESNTFMEAYGLRGLDGYRMVMKPLEDGTTEFHVLMSPAIIGTDHNYPLKAAILLLAFLEERYLPFAGLKRLPEHRLPYKGAVLYEFDEGDDDTAARICKDIIMECSHSSLCIEDIRGDSSIIQVEHTVEPHSHLHIRFRTRDDVIAELTQKLSDISGSLTRLINKD